MRLNIHTLNIHTLNIHTLNIHTLPNSKPSKQRVQTASSLDSSKNLMDMSKCVFLLQYSNRYYCNSLSSSWNVLKFTSSYSDVPHFRMVRFSNTCRWSCKFPSYTLCGFWQDYTQLYLLFGLSDFLAAIDFLYTWMRWPKHVANMEEGDVVTGFWWENLRSNNHFGDQGVSWWIILIFNFKK
jgi:hypothetical protein